MTQYRPGADVEEIRYFFPFIGNLTTRLEGDAAKVYRFLNSTGEIARLKDLDHLGLIRDAYEAAHHSRWEYSVLTMCLIDSVRQNEQAHLEGPVDLNETLQVDHAYNLLKSWAMLGNVGHLVWTFVSERSLLECLAGKKAYRQALEACLDPEVSKWLWDRVIAGRIYNYHEALAYLRIQSLLLKLKDKNAETDKQFCRHIIRKFLIRGQGASTSQFARISYIFKRIRQIAYLGLDSFHTPAPLKLDLRQMLTDNDWLGKFVLPSLFSEQEDLLAVDHFYYRNVYTSRRSLAAVAAREKPLREAVADRAEALSQEKPQQWIHPLVEELASGKIQRSVQALNLNPVVRLCLPGGTKVEQPSDSIVSVTWPDPTARRQDFLQLHSLNGVTSERIDILRLAFAQLETIAQAEQAIAPSNATELLEAALRTMLPNPQWWEWREIGSGPKAIIGYAQDVSQTLRSLPYDGQQSRLVEIEASRSLLTMIQPRLVAVALRQVTAWPHPRARSNSEFGSRPWAEFDGVMVARSQDSIDLYVLEAKSDRMMLPMAATNLRDRVIDLGGKLDRVMEVDMKKNGCFAWCNVRLPQAR